MANSMNDFVESDITKRTHNIIDSFIAYLGECNLLEASLAVAP